MKRFAGLFVALVLSIQVTGCGGSPATTGRPADDSNLPSEVKEYEARREAERAAKQTPTKATKHTAKSL
jgi:hypothetical protein